MVSGQLGDLRLREDVRKGAQTPMRPMQPVIVVDLFSDYSCPIGAADTNTSGRHPRPQLGP